MQPEIANWLLHALSHAVGAVHARLPAILVHCTHLCLQHTATSALCHVHLFTSVICRLSGSRYDTRLLKHGDLLNLLSPPSGKVLARVVEPRVDHSGLQWSRQQFRGLVCTLFYVMFYNSEYRKGSLDYRSPWFERLPFQD